MLPVEESKSRHGHNTTTVFLRRHIMSVFLQYDMTTTMLLQFVPVMRTPAMPSIATKETQTFLDPYNAMQRDSPMMPYMFSASDHLTRPQPPLSSSHTPTHPVLSATDSPGR